MLLRPVIFLHAVAFLEAHTDLFLFFFLPLPLVLATQPLKIVILKKTTRQARNNHWLDEALNKYGNIDKESLNSAPVSCFILQRKSSPRDEEK